MPNLTLAQLNTIAQEIANELGHVEQELLLDIHALIHREKAKNIPSEPTPEPPATETTQA